MSSRFSERPHLKNKGGMTEHTQFGLLASLCVSTCVHERTETPTTNANECNSHTHTQHQWFSFVFLSPLHSSSFFSLLPSTSLPSSPTLPLLLFLHPQSHSLSLLTHFISDRILSGPTHCVSVLEDEDKTSRQELEWIKPSHDKGVKMAFHDHQIYPRNPRRTRDPYRPLCAAAEGSYCLPREQT